MPTHTPKTLDFAALPENRWPGRLAVDGKTLEDFVLVGEEPSPKQGWTLRVFQSESTPGLQIRAQWRSIGAVTEWIPTLVNNSPSCSGKVSDVRSLAVAWPTRGPVDFYGNKGSSCQSDDFVDRIERHFGVIELTPWGGRSSDRILPFFAVTDRHDSFAVGIGWSGVWCAALRDASLLSHISGDLQVEVGLPNLRAVLRPWESVSLPSVLLASAPGANPDQARRLVRSHLTNAVLPRTSDGKSPNSVPRSTMYKFLHEIPPVMNEKAEMAELERAATMGFETWWVDAGWYGNDTNWIKEVGNWHVRQSDFPRGLRPLSDRAHELGMKFLFWMEPERAQPHTEWVRNHPDLFLSFPADKKPFGPGEWYSSIILNLADPRAVDLAFEKISSLITEFNADIYRQDLNIRPFEAWYAADAPDRIGITEIRYIEGLYTLWDRLLAAHPGLLIDNCASGGRRIDLEALRRSVPLWRSDYLMIKAPTEMPVINQTQGWGLGHWVSDHLGWVKSFDAYAVRSTLATGFMIYCDLPENEQAPEYADAIAAVAEGKRLRDLLSEERIGLIAPDLDEEAWAAFQHHRHSDGSGIIVALRGPGADSESVTLSPEHIEANATYQVTRWNDYLAAPPAKIAGAELQEIVVTIAQKSSSVLLEYQRVKR